MKLGIIRCDCSEESFKFAKGKGLDFIEVCLNYADDSKAFLARVKDIGKLIGKYEMPVLSIGRWNGDGGPLDDKGKIKPAYVSEVKKVLQSCDKLGCPVFHCGCNRVEGLSLFRNYEAAIAWFRTVIEIAKPYGIKVSSYNCHWNNFIDNAKAWEIVHGEIPELGIKFDPTHSIRGGRDYMAELRDWGTRVTHVHIKGALELGGQYIDNPPAGLDQINWRAFFGMLYKCGYDGTLSIEPHSATWQGDLGERGIDLTIRYMRSLMV